MSFISQETITCPYCGFLIETSACISAKEFSCYRCLYYYSERDKTASAYIDGVHVISDFCLGKTSFRKYLTNETIMDFPLIDILDKEKLQNYLNKLTKLMHFK